MSVNKVILLGNVGKDPDVRYPAQGQIVATFSLATTERAYTAAGGQQVPERTEWHRIVMWGKNAEIAERYIRRGTKLYIEGKLRTRTWEDRNTIKHTVTEVYADTFELLGSRPQATAPSSPRCRAPAATPATTEWGKCRRHCPRHPLLIPFVAHKGM
jgi:single-strand DNA-binding protein